MHSRYWIWLTCFMSLVINIQAIQPSKTQKIDPVKARNYILNLSEITHHDMRKIAEAFIACVSDGQQDMYAFATQFAHELIHFPPKNHEYYNSLRWHRTLYIEDALELYLALTNKKFDPAYEYAAQGVITAVLDQYTHTDAFRLLRILTQLGYKPAEWYSLQAVKHLISKKCFDGSRLLNVLIDAGYEPAIRQTWQWIQDTTDVIMTAIFLLPLVRNKYEFAFDLACIMVKMAIENQLLHKPYCNIWNELIDALIIAQYEPIKSIASGYATDELNRQKQNKKKNNAREFKIQDLCKNLTNLVLVGYEPAYETATNLVGYLIAEKEGEKGYLYLSSEKELLLSLIEKRYKPACKMIQDALDRDSSSMFMFYTDFKEKLSA